MQLVSNLSKKVLFVQLFSVSVFTTFAVDNIDHNPSSRDAKDSWHETAISSTQHLKGTDDGEMRIPATFTMNDSKIKDLPHQYTNVIPFALKSENLYPPALQI